MVFSLCFSRSALWVVQDRKSTRLNSSHDQISYAVFCLKKKSQPPTDVVALLRSGLRQIEDTVQAMVLATIDDRHHDRFAVVNRAQSDHLTQRKPPASLS